MKKYIIAGLASIGFAAVIAANTNNVQIKQKQELPLPEVILDPKGNKQYKYDVTFEFNIPVCTRDIPNGSSTIPVNYAEDSIDRIAVHCKQCSIGVYSEHEGEEGRSCTYCKSKEK